MIKYLENNAVTSLFATANVYRKKVKTLLRKPLDIEINQKMPTFVKDGDTVRVELMSIVEAGHIIARNEEVLSVIPAELPL